MTFPLAALFLFSLGWADDVFKKVEPSASIEISLRYASDKNFTGRAIYPPDSDCRLHELAFNQIRHAADLLTRKSPGMKLLLLDCLRSRSVQKKFWEIVKGTPKQPYVANPLHGSIHNYGFAVDLTIVDESGRELDMGTPFDAFEKLAQPDLEEKFLRQGKLSAKQIENRKLLRGVMVEAGFVQLPLEWWHYDAIPPEVVRKNYPIVE